MNSFNKFLKEINQHSKDKKELQINDIQKILSKINEYFFTEKENLGQTIALGKEYVYFSEFHKFWKKYHRQIINPVIDKHQCESVADILHNMYLKYGKNIFYEIYDTQNLSKKEICKIRFFSANQDFRGSRNFQELIKIYSDDPSIFDTTSIKDEPENFLKNLKIGKLSQNDKRIKYAKTVAELIISNNITEPFDLLEKYNNDFSQLKNALINLNGSGFGNKKTDMFLRDMFVLNVWKNTLNFDKIDVASDINTIKVALRTKILETNIPLLSSFLDIFCYQYSLIDEINAKAWRTVWEIWKKKYPNECIESPCLMDYLIYRIIGKEFCKERLCFFRCEEKGHIFKWHSGKNQTCQICFKETKKRNKATLIRKILPCSDNEGYIYIQQNKYVKGNNAILKDLNECPFASICNPKDKKFKKLNPPKSISILGQTGWDSARTKEKLGGGGLMS